MPTLPMFVLSNDNFTWKIRPIDDSIAHELHQVIANNSEHLTYWLPNYHGRDSQITTDFVNNVVAQHELFYRGEKSTMCNFVITTVDDAIIGVIGVIRINYDTLNAEIGYWLGKDYCGKGIVTTSTAEVRDKIAFELLKLKTIELHCLEGNAPSQNVAKRLKPDHVYEVDETFEVRGIAYSKIVYVFNNPSISE
jgi:ribosomal-protein-serine acetyltransferase